MKSHHKIIIAAIIALSFHTVRADISYEYYSPLHGLCGAELKEAVHQLVGLDESIVVLSYGSGINNTWGGFYQTDRNTTDNSVIDRYSNDTFYFGEIGASVSGMNIEHSFPKSWWGGSESVNAYKDLFNLMPSESKINQSKSNYPMGIVTTANKANNGVTKVGIGTDGSLQWEPADKWKGDFARSYLYMATAYSHLTWAGTQALQCLQNNSYPTFKPWAYNLYLDWAQQDRVSSLEVERNNAVESIQHNRNPFIDFPNLGEYIWGDSIDTPLNLLFTEKSSPARGHIIDSGSDNTVTLYENTFLSGNGGCTIKNTLKPSAISAIWKNNSTYGWVAKASTGSSANITNYASDASLLTPEFTIPVGYVAYFTFEHACKFASSPKDVLQVGICTKDGIFHPLTVTTWPKGSNWTFYNSGKVYISEFAGETVRIQFRYTSSDTEASTWEINTLKVEAAPSLSTINEVRQEPSQATTKIEYFSIDGRRVDPSSYKGLVIIRQGNSVTKTIMR